jgi:integrase
MWSATGELLSLKMRSIQMREEHWVVADLHGKAGHIRTIPIPVWVKAAIDQWTAASSESNRESFPTWRSGLPAPWATAQGLCFVGSHFELAGRFAVSVGRLCPSGRPSARSRQSTSTDSAFYVKTAAKRLKDASRLFGTNLTNSRQPSCVPEWAETPLYRRLVSVPKTASIVRSAKADSPEHFPDFCCGG